MSGNDPRVVGVSDDRSHDILDAVRSRTARTVLEAVHEQPGTASDLAGRLDMSVQNVSYHLENLTGAGLVEVAETKASTKGHDMNVYAPAAAPVVVVLGATARVDEVRSVLGRVLGAVAVLTVVSLLVQALTSGLPFLARPGAGRPNGAVPFPPGLAFFAGGLFVLMLVGGWWYRRRLARETA